MATMYLLVLMWGSGATSSPVLLTHEECQAAGAAWLKGSATIGATRRFECLPLR